MFAVDSAPQPGPTASALCSSVLAVGNLAAGLSGSIRRAVERTGDTVSFQTSAVGARHELGATRQRPRCVLVDEHVSELADLIEWLRNDAGLFDIPVIALVSAPTETAFAEAKRSGADDAVVRDDWAGIARRLAALDCFVPGEQPLAIRGTALVAHPDASRRRRVGWILRRAGYDLAFASSEQELLDLGRSVRPKLLVAAEQLLPTGHAEDSMARVCDTFENPHLPVVVLIQSDRRGSDYAGLRHTAASVDDGNWARLLFQVGELTRPDVTDLRSSPRTYLSAFCAFREHTEFEPVYGLTYNVSRGGMFVCSMDPPRAESTISVELRPNDGTREVLELRGQVVWVQRPLHGSTGATPAGFGVRLIPEACPPQDIDRYHQMCDTLHAEQFPAPSSDAERYRRMYEAVASTRVPSLIP